MKLLCADQVREYERWSSETICSSTGRKAAVVHTELESVQESLRLKGMFSLCHSWTRGVLFGNCNRNKCFLVGWIEKVKAAGAWSAPTEGLAVRLLIARVGRAFWVKARWRLAEVGLREDGWFQGWSALCVPSYTFIYMSNQGVFTLQGVIFICNNNSI